MKKQSFFKRNGLSIALLFLFLLFWIGQALTGWQVYNEELAETYSPPINLLCYLQSGHFVSSTFENWESEFLQMFIFVVFSIFLFQKGSTESKSLNDSEEVNQKPDSHKSPHYMIRQGGILAWIYTNSLSITLFLFFLCSFLAHAWGSYQYHSVQQILKQENPLPLITYLLSSDFWFESFQNWQSEFLAVFVIVYFTVFLRQRGSSQSKPVDAEDSENE